jgi:hypothetical protein
MLENIHENEDVWENDEKKNIAQESRLPLTL